MTLAKENDFYGVFLKQIQGAMQEVSEPAITEALKAIEIKMRERLASILISMQQNYSIQNNGQALLIKVRIGEQP